LLLVSLAWLGGACSTDGKGIGGFDAAEEGSGGSGGKAPAKGGASGAGTGGSGGAATGGSSGSSGSGGSVAKDGPDATTTPATDAMAADGAPSDLPAPTPDVGADVPPPKPDMALPVDAFVPRGPGGACEKNSECKSNLVCSAEKVCCNRACNGVCESCVADNTGGAGGTCAPNKKMEGMKCGQGCGQYVQNIPALFEKVCADGRCLIPAVPKLITPCADTDPCTSNSCDDEAGRCVTLTCGQQAAGECCCNTNQGRMCLKTDMCKGERMCVQ
jgi:hypothetical protein